MKEATENKNQNPLPNHEANEEVLDAAELKKQITYKKFKRNQILNDLLPLIGFLVLFIIYTIVCIANGYSYTDYLWATFDRGVFVALMSIGASFLFTLGQFDMSLGSAMGLSAAVGLLVYMSTGNIGFSLISCILAAMLVALCNILFSSVLRVPIFIMSIAMMTVLQQVILAFITAFGESGSSQINLSPNPFYGTFMQTNQFRLLMIILYFLFCLVIFKFLKFGRKAKFLGGNPFCARLTGISTRKNSIIAFLLCAIGVGLTAICYIGESPTVTSSTGSTYGMDIMVAIVIGGMPMSGGARSKITAPLIGSFTLAFLEELLRAFPATSGEGMIQIFKAILFIGLVYASSRSYRTKTLPR